MYCRTDELLTHSVPLPQVFLSQHENIDDAHQRHHVWDVIGAVKLVHDHTEAVLLLLQTLNTNRNKTEIKDLRFVL